jgi:hypothetical protein
MTTNRIDAHDWRSLTEMERLAALLEERKGGLRWFLCTFKAENGESLGHAFIQAFGPTTCSIAASLRAISPGGRMTTEPVTEECLPPEDFRHRFLTPVGAGVSFGLVQ